MDYMSSFAISASGMAVERMRLDVTSLNLANVNSTRAADGSVYKPLTVISGPRSSSSFVNTFDALSGNGLANGVGVTEVRQMVVPPRMVYEPNHPDADEKGFVSYPGINSVSEMVNLVSTLRAYEANVVAMNAAKAMATKALEIGGNS
jgi:flagellar basal-body rod protein FlgC